MKASRLQRFFSKAFLMMLLLSLLLMNTASAAPEVNPPGDKLMPTFSGVYIKDIKFEWIDPLALRIFADVTLGNLYSEIVNSKSIKADSIDLGVSLKNTSSTTINGKIKENPLIIDDNLEITGEITSKKDFSIISEENLNIGGRLLTSNPFWETITKSIWMFAKNQVYVKTENGLILISSGSDLDLNAKQDIDINAQNNIRIQSGNSPLFDEGIFIGNNEVIIKSSKFKAPSFGTSTVREAGPFPVATNTTKAVQVSCNAGEILLSCGYRGANADGTGTWNTFDLKRMSYSGPTGSINPTRCNITAKNVDTVERALIPYALCLDPSL